jgi:hypothetical protein
VRASESRESQRFNSQNQYFARDSTFEKLCEIEDWTLQWSGNISTIWLWGLKPFVRKWPNSESLQFLELSSKGLLNNSAKKKIKTSGFKIGDNCQGTQEAFVHSCKSIVFESNSRWPGIESEAFWSSSLQLLLITNNVESLESQCFSFCESLSLIPFESNSHLTRIESETFSSSSLQSIRIPRNVEVLGSECFSSCRSLLSITFESNSRLTRIESRAFYKSSASQIRLADGDCCPEFGRWLQLK